MILHLGVGRGHAETDDSEVKHQEKDIEMSRNTVYDQVNNYQRKIVLNENVAYCSPSHFVSS